VSPKDATPLIRHERHWLHPVCAWLALGVPLLVTLMRASAFPQWRDDLSVVRALGLVPIGGEGTMSSLLMQAFALLPIGGRLLRASLASAVVLAIAARLAYALTLRVLEQNAWTPRLSPPLALAAALTTALAPTWQLEGTIAGGAPLASALMIAGLLLRPSSDDRDARVWLGFGAFIGLTTIESHAAGITLLAALGVQIFVLAEVPPRRSLALASAGMAVTIAFGLVPVAVRPWAQRAWVHLGYTLSSASVAGVDVARESTGGLAAWFREVGLVATVLAFGGAAWGLVREKTRWIVAPLAVLVIADLAFPASRAGTLSADSLAPLRLSAIAALALAAGLAIQTASVGLQRAEVPMARHAAMLLVAFDFTLVLVTAEDSGYPADRRLQNAAEVWTDEALGELPPRALLLVRTETVAWRLWAAHVTRGERPDVVVVPLPLLGRGSVARNLLAIEPALAPLVRDMAVDGKPSELALSQLADIRPLFVELDPSWDRRLVDHLVPQPFWLKFAPHAYGPSDRRAALKKGRRPFRRVLDAAQNAEHRDRATLAMLRHRAEEQAVALATLGDRDSVEQILDDLRAIDPEQPFLKDLEGRLKKKPRGRVDVVGLLE